MKRGPFKLKEPTMKHVRTICMTLAILVPGLLFPAGIYDYDSDEWSKIEIREAFISRQTSIDFADSFSAPEFGWHINRGGAFLTRGNALYSTMYAPFPVSGTLRLVLVELDVFSDDIVSGVDLEPDKTRYVLNNNGDFVVIERTPFLPDRNSGGDSKPAGARPLDSDRKDSVSFLDGDYTDCYRLQPGLSSAVFIFSGISAVADAPGDDDTTLHPARSLNAGIIIASSERGGGIVRIRGAAGSGKTSYQVFTAFGGKRFDIIFSKAMKYLAGHESEPSFFLYRDMAKAFRSYDRESTIKRCGEHGAAKADRTSKFCEAVKKEESPQAKKN